MTGPVLLLGSSGQVGTALARSLDQVIAPSRRDFDLARADHVTVRHLIESTRPDAIVNCAAYTAVDRAEDESNVAESINGKAVGVLADVAAAFDLPFLTYSTDYVFDGRADQPYVESSSPDPINAYGRSKLIGELLALEANPRTLLIRTSWVVSGTHPNFIATVLEFCKQDRSVRVVNDQQGCPTIADDLASATLSALRVGVDGVLHLTNQGATTWFDFARAAVGEAGLDQSLVSPCTTAERPTRAPRPAYSVLGSERAVELGVTSPPPWRDSLPNVVKQLMTGSSETASLHPEQ